MGGGRRQRWLAPRSRLLPDFNAQHCPCSGFVSTASDARWSLRPFSGSSSGKYAGAPAHPAAPAQPSGGGAVRTVAPEMAPEESFAGGMEQREIEAPGGMVVRRFGMCAVVSGGHASLEVYGARPGVATFQQRDAPPLARRPWAARLRSPSLADLEGLDAAHLRTYREAGAKGWVARGQTAWVVEWHVCSPQRPPSAFPLVPLRPFEGSRGAAAAVRP